MKSIIIIVLITVVAIVGYMVWSSRGAKSDSPGVMEKAGTAVDDAADRTVEVTKDAAAATKDAAGRVVEKTGEVLEKAGAATEDAGAKMQK